METGNIISWNGSLFVSTFPFAPYTAPWVAEILPVAVQLNLASIKTWIRRAPGFHIELVMELISTNKLRRFSQVVFKKSTGFGTRLSNGKWDGMVGDIANNISHVSIPALFPSLARLKVVDFVLPPTDYVPLCFVVNPSIVAEIRFADCFTLPAWTGFMGFYIFMVFSMTLKSYLLDKTVKTAASRIFNLSFQPELQTYTDTSGAILTVLWTHFVSRMLFVAFASIIYYQTQKAIPLPYDYSDIPRFLNRYKLVMLRNNYLYTQIVTSKEVSFLAIKNALNEKNAIIFQNKELGTMMGAGTNRMSFENCGVVQSMTKTNHELVASGVPFGVLAVTMAIGKAAPSKIKLILRERAEILREHGIVDRLMHRYIQVNLVDRNARHAFTIATYSNTFLIYAYLILTSVVVLLCFEILLARYHHP